MSDIATAISPETPTAPTAKEGPVNASPSSTGLTKVHQQRRASVSQATAKAQQQRRASTSQAASKTRQQHENSDSQRSPKVVIQQWRQSAPADGSALVGNKRKIKTEEQSSMETDPQINTEGADKGSAQLGTKSASPPKKQKMEEMKTKVESTQYPPSTLPANISPTTPTPHHAPMSEPPIPSKNLLLIRHVLQTHPSLLPTFPSPITSFHIDAIAHTMWQVAFNHGPMLQRACQYSAIFSPLKLAALAKLNFLPSWWFFREMVVKELPGLAQEMGVAIDDGETQGAWIEAVGWCIGMLGNRVDMKGIVGEEGKGMMHVDGIQEGGGDRKMEQ